MIRYLRRLWHVEAPAASVAHDSVAEALRVQKESYDAMARIDEQWPIVQDVTQRMATLGERNHFAETITLALTGERRRL